METKIYKFRFTLALMVAMLIGAANLQAASYDIYILDTQVTDGNKDDLTVIPGVKGTVKYNPASKTLTLKDATISSPGTQECIKTHITGTIIEISGTNKLTGNGYSPIACKSNASLTIQGSGSLDVYNAKKDDTAIWLGTGSLTIKNINLTAKGGKNAITLYDHNNSVLTIDNANVTVSLNSDGVKDGTIFGFKNLVLKGSIFSTPKNARYNPDKRTICEAMTNEIIKSETKIVKGTGYDLFVCDVQVTDLNKNDLSFVSGVTAGTLKYDSGTNTLRLENATMSTTGKVNAVSSGVNGLKLELIGTNTLTGNTWSPIYFWKNGEIMGGGIANINNTADNDAIYIADCTVTIRGCTVNAKSGNRGIAGKDASAKLIIENADVTAEGPNKGSIAGFGEITLNACRIEEPTGAIISQTNDGNLYGVRNVSGNIIKTKVRIIALYDLTICGTQVTSLNKDDLSVINGVQGTASYNSISKTLSLKDVTMSITGNTHCILSRIEGLTIQVSGTNNLTSDGYAALDFAKSATIQGDGKLNVTNMADNRGIYVNCPSLLIKNCTVSATSGKSGIHGAYGTETLTIDNATVTAKGTNEGAIIHFKEIKLTNCFISTPVDGKISNGNLTTSSGAIYKGEAKIEPGVLYNLKICGYPVTSVNKDNLKAAVPNIVEGAVAYNPDTKILTLSNATMSTTGSVACILSRIDGIKIEVIGTNTLTGDGWAPVSFEDDTSGTIQGSGTLKISNLANDGVGVYSRRGSVNVRTLKLNITVGGTAFLGANDGNKTLTFENATVSALGRNTGAISSFNKLVLNECVIAQPTGALYDTDKKALCYNTDGNIIKEEVKILPGTNYDLKVNGVTVTSLNKDDLTVIPGVKGTVNYNPNTKTLKLENADISITGNINAIRSNINGINLELIGKNNVSSNGWSSIQFAQTSGNILGGGTLTVNNPADDYGIFITGSNTLTIKNSTVAVTAGKRGFNANGSATLSIENATVKATGTNDGSIIDFAALNLNGVVISKPVDAIFNAGNKAVCYASSGAVVKEEVSIVPGAAYDLLICGVPVTTVNKDNLKNIPGVTAGTINYNHDIRTLTLNGATISTTGKICCILSRIDNMTINVIGTNNLSGDGWTPIAYEDDNSGTIQGTGTLNIKNTNKNDAAIYMKNGSLTIKNCWVNASGGKNVIFGGTGNKELSFENATVTASLNDDGVKEGTIMGFKDISFIKCRITEPVGALFNATKKAICDADGNIVKATVKIIGESTDVNELNSCAITLYPNPVQDILRIDTDKTVKAVSIYNVQGKAVADVTGNVSEINLSHLSAGIYMVRIAIGETVSTVRIIKK